MLIIYMGVFTVITSNRNKFLSDGNASKKCLLSWLPWTNQFLLLILSLYSSLPIISWTILHSVPQKGFSRDVDLFKPPVRVIAEEEGDKTHSLLCPFVLKCILITLNSSLAI